jgi:hypothetical protein
MRVDNEADKEEDMGVEIVFTSQSVWGEDKEGKGVGVVCFG